MRDLRDELDTLSPDEDRRLSARAERLGRARAVSRTLIAVVAFVGITGGLTALWLFSRDVARRVSRVTENAQRLAGSEPLLGGSTFCVELPASATPVERARTIEDAPAPESTNGRLGLVLYIEDNAANSRLMERILRQRPQVEFLSATAAEEGLALVRARRPDLVFLDLHLPDLSGEEVLQRLWEDPEMRDVPSVVLTADATPGLKHRLKAAGALGHRTKPLNIGLVLELVDRFVRG